MLDEEINGRNYAIEQGVKDLSKFIKLPCNDFTCIDEKVTTKPHILYVTCFNVMILLGHKL